MNEDEVKRYVAEALRHVVDDAEVRVRPQGIVLEFLDGDRFLFPNPMDVGDGSDEEEGDEDEEEGYDPDDVE